MRLFEKKKPVVPPEETRLDSPPETDYKLGLYEADRPRILGGLQSQAEGLAGVRDEQRLLVESNRVTQENQAALDLKMGRVGASLDRSVAAAAEVKEGVEALAAEEARRGEQLPGLVTAQVVGRLAPFLEEQSKRATRAVTAEIVEAVARAQAGVGGDLAAGGERLREALTAEIERVVSSALAGGLADTRSEMRLLREEVARLNERDERNRETALEMLRLMQHVAERPGAPAPVLIPPSAFGERSPARRGPGAEEAVDGAAVGAPGRRLAPPREWMRTEGAMEMLGGRLESRPLAAPAGEAREGRRVWEVTAGGAGRAIVVVEAVGFEIVDCPERGLWEELAAAEVQNAMIEAAELNVRRGGGPAVVVVPGQWMSIFGGEAIGRAADSKIILATAESVASVALTAARLEEMRERAERLDLPGGRADESAKPTGVADSATPTAAEPQAACAAQPEIPKEFTLVERVFLRDLLAQITQASAVAVKKEPEPGDWVRCTSAVRGAATIMDKIKRAVSERQKGLQPARAEDDGEQAAAASSGPAQKGGGGRPQEHAPARSEQPRGEQPQAGRGAKAEKRPAGQPQQPGPQSQPRPGDERRRDEGRRASQEHARPAGGEVAARRDGARPQASSQAAGSGDEKGTPPPRSAPRPGGEGGGAEGGGESTSSVKAGATARAPGNLQGGTDGRPGPEESASAPAATSVSAPTPRETATPAPADAPGASAGEVVEEEDDNSILDLGLDAEDVAIGDEEPEIVLPEADGAADELGEAEADEFFELEGAGAEPDHAAEGQSQNGSRGRGGTGGSAQSKQGRRGGSRRAPRVEEQPKKSLL